MMEQKIINREVEFYSTDAIIAAGCNRMQMFSCNRDGLIFNRPLSDEDSDVRFG